MVNASHTRSRGASNERVATTSRSDGMVNTVLPLLFAAMAPSLFLQCLQVLVEPVEARIPELPEPPGPLGDLFQWRRPQLHGAPLRLPPPRDEPRSLEHPE